MSLKYVLCQEVDQHFAMDRWKSGYYADEPEGQIMVCVSRDRGWMMHADQIVLCSVTPVLSTEVLGVWILNEGPVALHVQYQISVSRSTSRRSTTRRGRRSDRRIYHYNSKWFFLPPVPLHQRIPNHEVTYATPMADYFYADPGVVLRAKRDKMRANISMQLRYLDCGGQVVGRIGSDDDREPPGTNSLCRDLLRGRRADAGGLFADFELVAGGGERFPCHRFVLAARSDAFRAMLSGPYEEAAAGVLAIGDHPASAVKHLLAFMYGNVVRNDIVSLANLLILADKYVIKELREASWEELATKLQERKNRSSNYVEWDLPAVLRNAVAVFRSSRLCRLPLLEMEAVALLTDHAQAMMQAGAWPRDMAAESPELTREVCRLLLARNGRGRGKHQPIHATPLRKFKRNASQTDPS